MNLPVAFPAVPERYRGVWQRRLLETPHLRDTDTTVFWLQTAGWHADIRIPAGRPDFSGVRSFADCTGQQLAWLVRQRGFAGVTQIDATPAGEVCRWHRLLDYQPPGIGPDAGLISFGAACMTETGIYAPYREEWHLLPDSHDGLAAFRLADDGSGTDDLSAAPARLLLVAGAYVMHVRNRAVAWPAGIAPGALLTADAVAAQHALPDFEISFGRRTADGWDVLHSTLPWLVGRSISMHLEHVTDERVDIAFDGVVQRWKMMEWQPPGLM